MNIIEAIKKSQSQDIPAIRRSGWIRGVIVKSDYGQSYFVRWKDEDTCPLNTMDIMANDWEVVE